VIYLSIAIPSISERLEQATILFRRLEEMFKGEFVEVLMFTDNKMRSIGEKRNDLKNLCKGKYIAQVDDDDKVTDKYRLILEVIKRGTEADVITFKQLAVINGTYSLIDFSLRNDNQEFQSSGITLRKPFHVCAWKRELVKDYDFPFTSYGEDYGWIEQFIDKAKTEEGISEVLHEYHHNINQSRADNEGTQA